MSRYQGKRTDVLQLPTQLRADPDLGAAVRFLASNNRRTIQMQILLWIVEGVEKEQSKLRQIVSGDVRPSQPKSVTVTVQEEKLA